MKDVAGYVNEKKELQEVCKVLQNIDKFEKMGLRMPKGIMLIGEPGVGKTVMAKALIRDSGLNCVKIDFDTPNEEQFVDYLQSKFKEAIKNGPSIIFMDELDKVCGEDNPFRPITDIDASRKILKVINDNESDKIMLLATINDKDMLHPAICRSGRFDRIIKIPLPSLEDRKEIIKYYANGKQFDKKVSFETLAKITGTFTGADIECIMNEAGLNAVVNEREVIIQEDIDKAVNRIVFQATEKEDPLDDKNKELVATHETGHLIAGLILDKENVGSVTIIPQGESGGHLKMGMECNSIKTKTEMLNKIIIGLAGKASEKVFFPEEEYLGSGSDFIKASSITETLLSVDCCFGVEYMLKPSRGSFDNTPVSDERLKKIEIKRDEILNECFEKAKKIIIDNVSIAKVFIDKLLKRYTLSREEILRIYNKEIKKEIDKNVKLIG